MSDADVDVAMASQAVSDSEVSGEQVEPPRLQISAVRIQNFKKISDTRIELGPITYLVGGNNSGKSSVLQALHTAVSCAQASVELGQRVVAEASLRYSPVADFTLLGHDAPYENRNGGQRGIVEFEGFAAETADPAEYRIEMYKARNHNNVGVERSGLAPGFGQVICDPKKLFSVYVPGLAGVPHREDMSGYAAVFRKAASGDANLVFRNIIRLLADRGMLGELERLVGEVLKSHVSFQVNFDPERNLYVDIQLAADSAPDPKDFLPVDLWGTGLLQITQIFAYVLLFKPALLLVDEPDSHLHPSRQKSLGVALERVSQQFHCKVIVSTHSRHLITSASEAVKVVWMKEGHVESSSHRELAALLMDLGALDQLDNSTKTIIYTEDENPKILKQALDSLSLPAGSVKIATFNGLNNTFAAQAFKGMVELMDSAPRVLIHRDRDFLTDQELEEWSRPFLDREIRIFCPPLCDTESYCASEAHIAFVTGMDLAEVKSFRDAVISENEDELRKKHREKRRYANRCYLDGGAPRTEALWPATEPPTEDCLYGKLLKTKMEEALSKKGLLTQGARLDDEASTELAEELRRVLEIPIGP